MRKIAQFSLLICTVLLPFIAFAQTKIPAQQAKNHIGETATVCGNVVSIHYAERTKGSPTFLNLEERYPNQIFTILIWGSDRSKFGDPEAKYANKNVCVTGLIKNYRGIPEIVAEQPNQIDTQK